MVELTKKDFQTEDLFEQYCDVWYSFFMPIIEKHNDWDYDKDFYNPIAYYKKHKKECDLISESWDNQLK